MTRQFLRADERPAYFVGSSYKELLALPRQVRIGLGDAIGVAQFGGKHPNAKPWKGAGSGVFEIVENYDGDTFRGVYTVRFQKAIYVLHVFQKKSKRGIKTDLADQQLIATRLREAERMYKEAYG